MSASSADVERDFSSASNLVTKRRTRMDPCFVELVLLLHLNSALLPPYDRVPDLRNLDRATQYVPRRFKDRALFKKYLALDPYKPVEDEEEEEMAEEMAREKMARASGGSGGGPAGPSAPTGSSANAAAVGGRGDEDDDEDDEENDDDDEDEMEEEEEEEVGSN